MLDIHEILLPYYNEEWILLMADPMIKDNPNVPPTPTHPALTYGPWTRALVISGNLENQILRPHSKPVDSSTLDLGPRDRFEHRLQVMLTDGKAWGAHVLGDSC